ncbi:predicted protein [Verticillium alfalfae VaMs.102]|uniref:Predicted protein n=1 Tax=Verticillium alfalfae (strain VaMs.102 / ATCC MYA-4576 / FGSC 10136) TaxID=526221 RepID=C9SHF9_VERA1|nr:predicted protein [Verticillium alfalfae VaMs.102]EEY18382.1 predicted protein [Verticillium alfalfae VaMs.102]
MMNRSALAIPSFAPRCSLLLLLLLRTTSALPQLLLPPAPLTGCLSAVMDLNDDIALGNPSAAASSIPTEPPEACRAAGFNEVLDLPYQPEDAAAFLGEIAQAIAE